MADTSRFHCFISHSNSLAPAASAALEPLTGHSTGNSKQAVHLAARRFRRTRKIHRMSESHDAAHQRHLDQAMQRPGKLPPSLDWDIDGTLIEKCMFHHVRRVTIPGFQNLALMTKLWNNYIIPLGYYSDSVKHALIGLGLSHRAFLDGYSHASKVTEDRDFVSLAMSYYGKALKSTLADSENLSTTSIRISLVSCLVFVCFEIIEGRYDKAIQHLRGGSRILGSIREAVESLEMNGAGALSPSQLCLAKTANKYFDQLSDIALMFSCIGVDTAYLLEAEVTPDLDFFLRSSAVLEASENDPFKTLDEARLELHRVEKALGSIIGFNFRQAPPLYWASILDLPGDMSPFEDEVFEAWMKARYRLDKWSARVDLSIKIWESDSSLSPEALKEAQVMTFIQNDWKLIIKQCETSTIDTIPPAIWRTMLDRAEAFCPSEEENSQQLPHFNIAADTVPPLVVVATFSRDPEVQSRAISLLYSMKRREGMWDSREIASILESINAVRASDLWDKEYETASLPTLAEKVLSRHLCCRDEQMPLATLMNQGFA
ncbi:C6 zinc finger protein [Colletotrichum scovillei]|uniref:C6 zinc finger protein n=1 Tax=Colletotrichum scovillei TaxID=1209932 RepID=UPI0015C3FB6A|nr:C6 zinc finger protein [Colletotrichum scovillei]KAF4782296.1 C6 zinc finger protein [Colletotrichum scovillei]